MTLNQIESYGNLIDVVVECGRYFSELALDVLSWSVLNALGGAGRKRLQADGMLTSPWLKALSSYAGSLAQRQTQWNFTPLLRYVRWQLEQGNSADLEILQEIVLRMSGIGPDSTYSEDQVLGLAAGPMLRADTLKALHDRRYERKAESRRLMKELNEAGVAADLLLLIGQEKERYRSRSDIKDAPTKVLTNNTDKIHLATLQYLEFLRTNMSIEDFDKLIPPINDLVNDFDIPTELAFEIGRPSLRLRLENAAKAAPKSDTADGEAAATPKAQQVNGTDSAATDMMVDGAMETDAEALVPAVSPALEPLQHILDSLSTKIDTANMSAKFFLRFWMYSLYDMQVPDSQYNDAIKRARAEVATIKADRSDSSNRAAKKRDERCSQLAKLQSDFIDEQHKHAKHFGTIKKLFVAERNSWAPTVSNVDRNTTLALSEAVISDCVLPRISLSPADAKYTALFLFLTHSSGMPAFFLIKVLDVMFDESWLRMALFSRTQREADAFGHFYREVLRVLHEWHAKKDVFEKAAWGPKQDLPGFAIKLKADLTASSMLPWETFRQMLYKWHNNLHNVLKAMLSDAEYMQFRNASGFLKVVAGEFPAVVFHGRSLVEKLGEIARRKDEGSDKTTVAASLLAGLKKYERKWVLPQHFKLGQNAHRGSLAKDSAASSPGSGQEKKTLDAKAHDFRPRPSGVTKGGEVEDGEIDDAKMADKSASGTATDATAEAPINKNLQLDKTSTPASGRARSQDRRPTTPSESGPRSTRLGSSRDDHKPSSRHSTPGPTSLPLPPTRSEHGRLSPAPAEHGLPVRPDPGRYASKERPRRDARPADSGRLAPDTRRHEDYGRLNRPDDLPGDDAVVRTEHTAHSTRLRGRSRSPGRQPQPDTHRDRREEPLRPPPQPIDSSRVSRGHTEARPEKQPPRDTRSNVASRNDSSRGDHPPREAAGNTDERSSRSGPQTSRNLSAANAPQVAAVNPASSASSTEPYVNPERAAAIQQGERALERAARDRPGHAGREPRLPNDTRSQRSPRPQSPARPPPADDRQSNTQPRSEPRRDDARDSRSLMPDRNQQTPSDHASQGRERRNDGPTPSGPRTDRNPRYDTPDNRDRARESSQTSGPSRQHVSESNQGRVASERSNPPAPMQLDAPPSRMQPPDVPSGPRGRGRGARQYAEPSPPIPVSPSADRLPPSGPASDRHNRRPSGQFDYHAGSAPSTPVNEIPIGNSSRMQQNDQPKSQGDVPTGPNADYRANGARTRGTGNFPPGPSPTSRQPPSGPAAAGPERSFEGRRMANLQNQLQPTNSPPAFTNDRGTAIRGHATRYQGSAQSSPGLAPPQQNQQSFGQADHDLPPRSDGSSRQDAHRQGPPMDRMTRPNQPEFQRPPAEERTDGHRHGRDGEERTSRRHRSDRGEEPREPKPREEERNHRGPQQEERRERDRPADAPSSDRETRTRGRGREPREERERDVERDRERHRDREREERVEREREREREPPREPPRDQRDNRRDGRAGPQAPDIISGRQQPPPTNAPLRGGEDGSHQSPPMRRAGPPIPGPPQQRWENRGPPQQQQQQFHGQQQQQMQSGQPPSMEFRNGDSRGGGRGGGERRGPSGGGGGGMEDRMGRGSKRGRPPGGEELGPPPDGKRPRRQQ